MNHTLRTMGDIPFGVLKGTFYDISHPKGGWFYPYYVVLCNMLLQGFCQPFPAGCRETKGLKESRFVLAIAMCL
jgi:hypothetical protein